MLMYLAARARRMSNLVAGFLANDLKKSPSVNPCAKALALTSWVAEGTSKAAEKRKELSKTSYRGQGQLVKPLLRSPSESSDEDSTPDVVSISMQQGCILESGQMFLWIGGAIVFCYGWGLTVHK
ncbi:UNVERIFIED_CONTAM: hypothetical protein Slati_1281100 [Sesamum latifolium]|uniref:Uncharacterized protein n=1 Tax=Sesamum latifolium TaxID=2727402 RepID=A0AAW2XMD5_9LAMI